MTLNAILKEMRSVPADKLDEVFQFVHALARSGKLSRSEQKEILSFAGSFQEMSAKDYEDFLRTTKKVRASTFNRKVKL